MRVPEVCCSTLTFPAFDARLRNAVATVGSAQISVLSKSEFTFLEFENWWSIVGDVNKVFDVWRKHSSYLEAKSSAIMPTSRSFLGETGWACKYRSMMAAHVYSISCSSLDLEFPCTSQSTRMACMQLFYLSHLRNVGLWTTAPQAALDTGRYPSCSHCRAEGSPSALYQYPQFCTGRHQRKLGRGSLPSWRCPEV